MFRSKWILALAIFVPAAQLAAKSYPGIGRPATPAEVTAWDIDVRPDFKGLPPGKGSVDKGQEVWEAKCQSCHGIFGESNEVFTPITGGVTKKAIETGRVETLIDGSTPVRTTFMKVPTISTIWDYVNRAMPWNAPKSLTTEEVYGVVAYMLHLNGIVPADFVLSHENIAEVQKRMPNRNGMTTAHGMWSVRGKPDVQGSLCMRNCNPAASVSSDLPAFARNAHGNLADQVRPLGYRGVVTDETAAKAKAKAPTPPHPAIALLNQHACMACHGMDNKLVGPGLNEIKKKHAGKSDLLAYFTQKIRNGGAGVWGSVPMPPQPQLSDSDIKTLAQWFADAK